MGDNHLQIVTLLLGDQRESQGRVSSAGLHQGLAWFQRAGLLGLLDKIFGNPVLDAAAGVEALQFANMRTPGFGLMRDTSTRGVLPMWSRILFDCIA